MAYASLSRSTYNAQDGSVPIVQEQVAIFEADYTNYLAAIERTAYGCAMCSMKGATEDDQHALPKCPYVDESLITALKD